MTAADTWPEEADITELPVDDLDLGLDFRLDEDPVALAELADSIGELGVLQPLTVRAVPHGWEVVAGRRRLAAARIAGLDVVPVRVTTLTDDKAADAALAENLHRRDLSPVEVALALARLRDQGLTQQQIGARVGRSQGTVGALLAVLELPAALRDRVHRRELSYRTALDLNGRRAYRKKAPGTMGAPPALAVDAGAVTYWRRRHDRLISGLLKVLRRRPDTAAAYFDALRHLTALDNEPIPGLEPPAG